MSEALDLRHGKSRSAEEEAYAFLLREIRNGRLLGSTHITAERISHELGISRIPVREAMRRLASEGFITIRSNRGAFVTELGADDITELYEMRAVLEGLASRYSAERFDERGSFQAHVLLQELDRARSDPDWFVGAHNQFHDLINSYCPRRRLVGEIVRLRTMAEPYLRLTIQHSPTAYGETVNEHRQLIEVLEGKHPARCEAVMRAHILGTDVLKLIPASTGKKMRKAGLPEGLLDIARERLE